VFCGRKEIRNAADARGIKLRVPEIQTWIEMARALGANPTPIPAAEVYTALQTGVVDAIEVPADFITTQKIFEVSRHATRTHHIFTEVSMFASARRMAGLSADNQKVIREAARRAVAEEMWAQNLREQTAAWADLASRVRAIPDPDVPSFRERMAPVISNFESRTGAKGKAFVDAVRAAA
jgi:TRAP-type C4-dicarboxylate transport system substrate-binding protein